MKLSSIILLLSLFAHYSQNQINFTRSRILQLHSRWN